MRRAALLLAALLLLAGCASETDRVRDHLTDRYGAGSGNDDRSTWATDTALGTVARDLSRAVEPAARAADGGAEYLRYEDDIVVLVPAAGGGTSITLEDLDERYRAGGFAYLGPGFTPGTPAGGDGGPGDAK